MLLRKNVEKPLVVEPAPPADEASIQTPGSPVSSQHSRLKPALFLLGAFLLVVIFSGGSYYYLGVNQGRFGQPKTTELPSLKVTDQAVIPAELPKGELFSGQLKRLEQNLRLFTCNRGEEYDCNKDAVVYYEAGKFLKSDLEGYTRIIAVQAPIGPGSPQVYTLATKDYQTFVLDDPDDVASKYPKDDFNNPFYYLDSAKVTSSQIFATELPRRLDLDDKLGLYGDALDTDYEMITKGGVEDSEYVLTTNFAGFKKLTTSQNKPVFYFKPISFMEESEINKMEAEAKKYYQIEQKYVAGTTEVVGVDSTGLAQSYTLSYLKNIAQYQSAQAKYVVDYQTYLADMEAYENDKIFEYPQYPEYVSLDGLGFKGADVKNQDNLKFFNVYSAALPSGCGGRLEGLVVELNDNELEKIGTVMDAPLFSLKDKNHPLLKLQYYRKMSYYNTDTAPNLFEQMNPGITKQSYEEYVASNPLLLMKDPWQRWVMMGEYDIQLPGGCGKPVVYLYPEIPTEVTVKFTEPVNLTTDIPKYGDSWKVLANPYGNLVNLKSDDCTKIDFAKRGSEYAKQACENNSYPYLYWAGNVIGTNYHVPDKGWVVAQADLSSFLADKLSLMGLNFQERADFVDYWLPELASKNTPYYRISFLQTQEVNSLFPMTVMPVPDTTFRIFMDYTPLTGKPEIAPLPQVLNKLDRKGFTLVEWGGLKLP